MKMANGRAPERTMHHTDECSGDGHGWFDFTSEMPDGAGAGWTQYTCSHCGTKTWRNTKGEMKA